MCTHQITSGRFEKCLCKQFKQNRYEECDDYYKHMTRDDWDRLYTIMVENKNKFFELFSERFFDLWD